jgi:hypothetical protein
MIRNYEDFEALKRKAADGDKDAQCTLADIYADDTRVNTYDVNQAVFWYEKAALQGHTKAQCLLGASYFQGMGVAQDTEKAEQWLIKSAQGGDADGQYTLGGFYFMKPDIVKAKYWLEKAAEQGHEESKTMLPAINQLLEI